MSNTNNLTDYVLMPGPDYQDMCNAIREKTGIAGDIISSQIGDIIRNIQGSVVLPKYTIKFYNNTTLLQTNENVVYGSSINYTGIEPTKNGYTFDRFEPSGARITGDTNCYAQFVENVVEPDEPEAPTTGEWVPFCADGTTWTGEEIDIANTGKGVRPAEYIGAVVISPTNQYRFTLGEDVYEGVNIDEYGKGIALENCPYYLKTLNAPIYRFNFISDADLYYTGPLKVESWTGSEPYAPEEPEEPETDTNWVLLCADGTTWSGEEVSNNAMLAGGTFETIDLEQVVTNQYRLTVDGTAYLCVDNGTGGSSYIEGNAVQIEGDGCPATIIAEDYSISPWVVTFNDGNAHTLKVEVWIGSEPYVPEEEGYTPTDGYQAFTTDGTWTGEEVTTAVATTDFTRYMAYLGSDIKYNNGSAVGQDPAEGTEILLTINGEQYLCSGVTIGSPKTIYRFTCDGCPASLVGGDSVGDSWALAFATAGTYTVKVEVPNESETPTLITFSADGTEYQAEEGMTWSEWIASEYNTDGFTKHPDADNFSIISQDWDIVYDDNGVVVVTDVIVADYRYWLDCCFVEGTQVMISLDGQTKNIEDVQAGEQVVSYNVKTGENYLTTVSKAITNNSSKFMAHVEFENGSELDMTEYHPIYTQNGWRSLKNYNGYDTLVVGDMAKTTNGWSKITNIVRYQNDVRTTTYTLDVIDIGENPDVEINDSFYANGIVVHNSACV